MFINQDCDSGQPANFLTEDEAELQFVFFWVINVMLLALMVVQCNAVH